VLFQVPEFAERALDSLPREAIPGPDGERIGTSVLDGGQGTAADLGGGSCIPGGELQRHLFDNDPAEARGGGAEGGELVLGVLLPLAPADAAQENGSTRCRHHRDYSLGPRIGRRRKVRIRRRSGFRVDEVYLGRFRRSGMTQS
jgi:hypothetical protein